ncbi:MAG: hypothetical protein V7L05_19455 [Nostoc sp.]|uniref:hypothetical protein n=1 Tax=Nostoc sp. TaxID=1180 RepID=UPI002FF5871F
MNSLKSAGNSIPSWVVEVAPPADWAKQGIGKKATSSPCPVWPIPHAQKLHPLVGGVFYHTSS